MHVSGFFLKTNSSTLSIHYSAYLHNEITVLKHFTQKKYKMKNRNRHYHFKLFNRGYREKLV